MIARVDQRIATANLAADTQLLGAAAVAAAAGLPAASVCVVREVDSTNAELMRAPARDPSAPAVLIAARQSAGRGRRGRRWITDAPAGLAISIGVERTVRSGAPRLIGLSPAIGVALAQALSVEAHAVELKWPNDLYRGGKKFAGVLVESRRSGESERVVVGVGLNWALDARAAQAIDQAATGLFEAMPALAERERIAGRIAAAVIAAVSGFFVRGMGDTARNWARFDRLAGREVVVSENGVESLRGIADGIDADGALRVIVAGRTVAVAVGDVSVRAASASTPGVQS
jgi:BirA family biotin operon repressor/biotin-[acetyl-CoA-carboxylase] ligase